MKPVDYKHSWSAEKTEDEEMAERFGTLLNTEDTSEGYDVSIAYLFKKGRKYYLVSAHGCSCWDGDFEGWELNKTDLIKLAKKEAESTYADSETLMARWVLENVKTR